MIIVFYRSKETNNIVAASEAREGYTMATLQHLAEEYNAKPEIDRIAEAVEVADDSLEAFLYQRRNERLKLHADELQEAIESIRHALYCVQDLESYV